MASHRGIGVALTLATLLLLVSILPAAARTMPVARGSALVASPGSWTHVGSGPLAISTRLTASVRYPVGILAGDLLLLSCQGKRNTMRWSAPGFGSLSSFGDLGPFGPAGLRWVLLSGKATGGESGTVVTVRNTTGVNGWSCSITAMRGGTPSDANFRLSYFDWGNVQPTPPSNRLMVNSEDWDVQGWLLTHWFVSSDDNDHRAPSHGTLAFGGVAYDTRVGTDHAASMVWHVGATPTCWPRWSGTSARRLLAGRRRNARPRTTHMRTSPSPSERTRLIHMWPTRSSSHRAGRRWNQGPSAPQTEGAWPRSQASSGPFGRSLSGRVRFALPRR